jgi:methylglyoxal synthase
MPLLKKIIKVDPREVIIKWTGTGTDTLTLNSLVATGQTVTGVLPKAVNIIGMTSSTDSTGAAIVTRNNEVTIHAASPFQFQTDGVIQAVLNENSGFDISVNLTTTGTLILRVKKMQGYSGI